MFNFIKEFIKDIEEKEAIHNFKMDNELLAKEIKAECVVFESEFRTYYHLTPFDLGENAVLEPRISNSVESTFVYAGISDKVRNFKCISFGYNISGCLVQLPESKLKKHNEFYVYRTKMPISGLSEYFLNNGEKTKVNEVRVFKDTEVIRIGKVIAPKNIYELIQELYGLEEEENIIVDKEILKHIEIKPDKKHCFMIM